MSSEQERAELDARARQDETVVPGALVAAALKPRNILLKDNFIEEQRRADEEGADRERRVLGDGSKEGPGHHRQVWWRACKPRTAS
ncbi:hypothetical protein ACSBR2_007809 [Camellia fascicularis]